MNLPVLNRQLVLESAQRAADGAGGFTETWVALGTLWAEVEARTGRERTGAEVTISTMRYRITVRAAPVGSPARPQPGQRLRDGARLFAIRAVSEADAKGRFLTCFAVEEVTT